MPKNTKKRAIIYSNVKANKKLAEEKNKIKDEQINLSDEVIIGFNSNKSSQDKNIKARARNNEENRKTKKQAEKNTNRKKVSLKKSPQKNKFKPQKKNSMQYKIPKEKNNGKIFILLKTSIVAIVIFLFVFAFLKSSIFNIKEIVVKVDNNSALTMSEIKELSNIAVGQNMFSVNKKKAIDSIKTNAYVENVKIKRNIPDKVTIEVVERIVKFQLESENGYIYVDNQGIVIDEKKDKKDCIIIVGQKTDDIIIGNKLNDEDLNGLSDVIKIIQEAENNEIVEDITKIDISNHDDYLVYFDNLGKVAHIGNTTSVNDKMTRIAKILKVESEVEGEIFVNVDLNNGKYPYFREKV
ncbi:MAG: FtsQ-type POTRA domain-containing protein [Clostridia bacterium]|nr:FtsQ-type POTRA domain-containing protein [Clostridia bacterium]